MTVKIPGNKTYALGTVGSVYGGLELFAPESMLERPLPTTLEGACALLLMFGGLGLIFIRQAIAKGK